MTHNLMVRLPDDAYENLKAQADRDGVSMNAVVVSKLTPRKTPLQALLDSGRAQAPKRSLADFKPSRTYTMSSTTTEILREMRDEERS